MRSLAFQFTLVLTASLLTSPARGLAQEVVHATVGTVVSIDGIGKAFTLLHAGYSKVVFKATMSPTVRVDFDKKMSEGTQPAAKFQTAGAYVVVFYFGGDGNQTAIALKNLGKGPFTATSGKVMNWDRHSHAMTITDTAGATHRFSVAPETIAETVIGAVDGSRYQAQKDEDVRIIGKVENGKSTALFVGGK